MKTAITGHTKGLGAALLATLPADTLCFSRSNGYDIENLDDRCRIVDAAEECDIFINNAHAGFGQVQLLHQLFTRWEHKPKLIVNIGSRASEYTFGVNWTYSAEKAGLMTLTKSLSMINSPCRVSTLCFGYIGTESILTKNPALTEYIRIDDAVSFISNILSVLVQYPTYRLPYLLYHA